MFHATIRTNLPIISMSSNLEIRRVIFDDDDPNIHLSITTTDNNIHYTFNKREGRPAMRFAREGMDAFLTKRALPIIIPPPAEDDGMDIYNHFSSHAEKVFHRGYVTILSSQNIFTSPALLLADPDMTVPDFFEQLGDFFGRSLRIVSPDVIQKYWGGRLGEFDEIIHHDGKRYRRQPITWSNKNDRIYASGIPIFQYLDLIDTHPPHPRMTYEDYFRHLRREAKIGNIHPNPWRIEELFPNQPRLF